MNKSKHLVISVSPDSSLDLLKIHADVIILDHNTRRATNERYDTVYIRSHFGHLSTVPQNYRAQIDDIVDSVERRNPGVRFVDRMDTVDAIVAFEDKWHQYQLFNGMMPTTHLLNETHDGSDLLQPIFKKRLSSRGNGVTWQRPESDDDHEWIVQESLDIAEELRIYVLNGIVYQTGVIRQHKTQEQNTEAVSARELSDDEIEFAVEVSAAAPALDILGLDVARAQNGRLYLLEANRSPGFAKFKQLTGINLADIFYKDLA